MVNVILGILTGIAGTCLFFMGTSLTWYVWALFGLGGILFIFSFDVLLGSFAEHQTRAAWMGFCMFIIPGSALLVVSWILGF